MTHDKSQNSKRIAKNTIMLYFRMLITMFVGLFTTRVILSSLGATDYGIYNVVGGFVTMFHVLSAGLTSATQRFLTFGLGKDDKLELRKTYSTFIIIYMMISALIIVVAETGGLWFLYNKMTIPADRMDSAFWVFQFSVLTFIVSLISTPSRALIIAHEKMDAFAYISIYEVFAKLAVAYLIYITTFDKLIVYAALLCLVQISIRFLYNIYSKKHFEESKMLWIFEKSRIAEIYKYVGWAMVGGISVVARTQALNVLLNMFFGPIVNAARGISVQIMSVVNSFVSNFQTALNPQIIKSYARGDMGYMHKLMYASSKYAYLMLFIISLPLLVEADYILKLWLKEVPEYSANFFRLIMITTVYDALANCMSRAVEATGKLKSYQLTVSVITLMIPVVTYIVLKLGGNPYSVYIVSTSMGGLAFIATLFVVRNLVAFSIRQYFKEVLVRIVLVSVISATIPLVLVNLMESSFLRFIVICLISVTGALISTYFIGLSKSERSVVVGKLSSIYRNIRKK